MIHSSGHGAGWRRIAKGIVLVLFVLFLAQTAYHELSLLTTQVETLRLFPDYAAQARTLQGKVLYDTLLAADALIPIGKTVIFVTPGIEPRQDEYIAYHRALYQLAPRAVWWVNPAVSDGTWESRWWIETPLATKPLYELATGKNAEFILFYHTQVPQGIGTSLALAPRTTLVSLGPKPEPPLPHTSRVQSLPEGGARGLASILVCLVLGACIIALGTRGGYAPAPVEAMALAWVLGAGLVSELMFWLDTVRLALDTQLWVISVLAVSVAGVKLLRIGSWGARLLVIQSPDPTQFVHPVDSLLTGWITIQTLYVAVLAIGRPLSAWDSWVTYAMKARLIFMENQLTPLVYRDLSRTVTHLDYPLLFSLLEAWTFRWVGTDDDRFTGILSVVYFVSLLCLVFAGLRRVGLVRTHALAVVAVLASLPHLNGAAGAVMADVPLALYALIAALYVLVWLEHRRWGALLIAAVAAGLMPWTKREGVILLASLGVALLALGWRERRAWIAFAAFVGAALVLAGPWWLLIARNGIVNSDFAPVTWSTYQANWMRLPSITYHIGKPLLNPNWLFLWLFVLALVLIERKQTRWSLILPFTACLYLAAISQAFIFSVYFPYQQHIASSIDRLVLHVVSLIVVWSAYALAHGKSERANVLNS